MGPGFVTGSDQWEWRGVVTVNRLVVAKSLRAYPGDSPLWLIALALAWCQCHGFANSIVDALREGGSRAIESFFCCSGDGEEISRWGCIDHQIAAQVGLHPLPPILEVARLEVIIQGQL